MADSLIEYISCPRRNLFLKELQKYGEVVSLNEVYGRHSPEKHHIIMGTVKDVGKFLSDENGSLIKLIVREYNTSRQKLKLFFVFVCNEFATILKNASLQPGDLIAFRNVSVEKNTMLDILPGWHDLQAIFCYRPTDGAKIFLMKASVEKPPFDDKPVTTNNALLQRASGKFNKVDMYKYTSISNITAASLECKKGINVYGVVKTIIKEPRQETKHAIVCVMDETCDNDKDFLVHIFFKKDTTCPNIKVNDIIRFHRMRVEQYNNKLDGRVFRSSDIVVFPPNGKDCAGARSTAQSYHFTASDAARLAELRRWIVSQAPPTESTIQSINQDLRATVLKDITEEGRYKIECKVLDKKATFDGLMVLTVVDGTVHPILGGYEVKITVTDPPEQFKQLKVPSLVSLEEVTASKNDPHTAQNILCFTMTGPDCFYEMLKGNDPRGIQLKRRIQKMKQSSGDTPINSAEACLCTDFAANTLEEANKEEWEMLSASLQNVNSTPEKLQQQEVIPESSNIDPITPKKDFQVKYIVSPSGKSIVVKNKRDYVQMLNDIHKKVIEKHCTSSDFEQTLNLQQKKNKCSANPPNDHSPSEEDSACQEMTDSLQCIICDSTQPHEKNGKPIASKQCENDVLFRILPAVNENVEHLEHSSGESNLRTSSEVAKQPKNVENSSQNNFCEITHDPVSQLRLNYDSQPFKKIYSHSSKQIDYTPEEVGHTYDSHPLQSYKIASRRAENQGLVIAERREQTGAVGVEHQKQIEDLCQEKAVSECQDQLLEEFQDLANPKGQDQTAAECQDQRRSKHQDQVKEKSQEETKAECQGQIISEYQDKMRAEDREVTRIECQEHIKEKCQDQLGTNCQEHTGSKHQDQVIDKSREKTNAECQEKTREDCQDEMIDKSREKTNAECQEKTREDCQDEVIDKSREKTNAECQEKTREDCQDEVIDKSREKTNAECQEKTREDCQDEVIDKSREKTNAECQEKTREDCQDEVIDKSREKTNAECQEKTREDCQDEVIDKSREKTNAECQEKTREDCQDEVIDKSREKTNAECQEKTREDCQDEVIDKSREKTNAECQEKTREDYQDEVIDKSQEKTNAECQEKTREDCQNEVIDKSQEKTNAECQEKTREDCQNEVIDKSQDKTNAECQEKTREDCQDEVIDKSQEKTNAECQEKMEAKCQEQIRTECQELTRTQFGAEASSGYEDYVRAECREQSRKESEERADFQRGELPPISDFSDNPSDIDIQSYIGNFMKLENGSAARDLSSETYSEFSEALRSKKDAEIFTSSQKCGNEPSSQTNDPLSDCESEVVPSSCIDENECPPRFSAISQLNSESVDSSRNSGCIELEFLGISGTSSSNNNISNSIQCAQLSENHQFYNESRPEESDIFSTTTSVRSKTTIGESSEHSFLSIDHKQNAPIRVDINSSSVSTKSSANQITNITESSFSRNIEKNLPDMLQKMNIYAKGNFSKVGVNNEIEDISKNNVRTETCHTSLTERDLQNSEKDTQEDVVQSYVRKDLSSRAEQNYQSIPENLATGTSKPESYCGNNLQDKCNTEPSEDSCYSTTKGSSERVCENTVARNSTDFNIITEDCHTNRKKSDNSKREDLLQCTVPEIRDDLHANRREIDNSEREDLPVEVSIDTRDVHINIRTSGISERDDSSLNMSSVTEQDDTDGSSNVREYVESGRNKVCSQDAYMVLNNSQNEEISMKKNINLEPVKGQIESTRCPFQPSSFHIPGDKFTFASGIVIKKNLRECCFHEVRRQPHTCVVRGWLSHLEPPLYDTFPLNNIVSGVCDECRRVYSFMSFRYDPRTHTAFCVICLQKGLRKEMELTFILLLHLLDENNDELVGTVSGFSANQFLGCTTMTYLEDEHTYHRVNNMLSKLLLTDSSTPAKERGPMLKLKVTPIATSTGIEFIVQDTCLFVGSG